MVIPVSLSKNRPEVCPYRELSDSSGPVLTVLTEMTPPRPPPRHPFPANPAVLPEFGCFRTDRTVESRGGKWAVCTEVSRNDQKWPLLVMFGLLSERHPKDSIGGRFEILSRMRLLGTPQNRHSWKTPTYTVLMWSFLHRARCSFWRIKDSIGGHFEILAEIEVVGTAISDRTDGNPLISRWLLDHNFLKFHEIHAGKCPKVPCMDTPPTTFA